MSKIRHSFDRRKQPQNSIQAIGDALAEIKWDIKEITKKTFILPKSGWTNESFGYELTVPKKVPIKELWVGFIKHVKAEPGIYAGINPDMNRDEKSLALKDGYRISEFGKHALLKQIITRKEMEKMEDAFGANDLKKEMKKILQKHYPFSGKR